MTISTTQNRYSYSGNGSTTAFSYASKFLANADLVVLLVDSDGVSATQVLDTDYTVTGAGAASGGTVTMSTAPASGETLVVYGDPDITQTLDLVNNDSFDADDLEESLDRSALINQRQNDKIDRALRLADADTAVVDTEINTTDAAGKYIRLNTDGDGFEFVGASPDDDTFTASGDGAVPIAWSAAISVKTPAMFRAVGDGSVDDTTAWDKFVAALDGSSIGIVPSGFWMKYANAAIKTYTGLEDVTIIFGANSGIKFTTNTKGGFNFDGCADFRIENMQVDYVTRPTGARVGTDQHALTFQNHTGQLDLIRPTIWSSPNMGIVAVECERVFMDHPRAYNTLADGIHTKDTPATIINPETDSTGDDGVACPRTVAGALTRMPVAVLGARVTNAGARGIAINGATDAMVDGYIINNTSQHGIIVARDETHSLATPQRVFIGKGRIDNAGQYTYTATTPTKGGHGLYLIGGDDSNEITIDGPAIYNANGHGISIAESASGNIGTVNLGNYVVDTTAVLTDGSNIPGRGVNVASVKKLNLFGAGVVKNAVGAGFYALDFDRITGELPDVINCNTNATYNDRPNFVKLNNTNHVGQAYVDGGNLIDTAGSPVSTTVEVDGATTGYAAGFKCSRGDNGGLLLSNIADTPTSFLLSGNNDLNETQVNAFSATNTGSTTLSSGRRRNINTNGSTIASHTLRLPTVTDQGHVCMFSTKGEITSLTVNAANGTSTVLGAPTTLAAGGHFSYAYRLDDDTWYRIG